MSKKAQIQLMAGLISLISFISTLIQRSQKCTNPILTCFHFLYLFHFCPLFRRILHPRGCPVYPLSTQFCGGRFSPSSSPSWQWLGPCGGLRSSNSSPWVIVINFLTWFQVQRFWRRFWRRGSYRTPQVIVLVFGYLHRVLGLQTCTWANSKFSYYIVHNEFTKECSLDQSTTLRGMTYTFDVLILQAQSSKWFWPAY